MIYVILNGRLGNQLFQYAAASALAKTYGKDICLLEVFEKNLIGNFILEKNTQTGSAEEIRKYKRWVYLYDKLFFVYCKINRIPSADMAIARYKFDSKSVKLLAKLGFVFIQNGYIDIPKIKKENIVLCGFFQCAKFFEKFSTEIINEISLKKKSKKLEKLLIEMDEKNAVCLHIRMGDYVNNPVFGICTMGYYQDAVDKMKELVSNPKFYVFSDEIQKVKGTIDFHNCEVVYVDNDLSSDETLVYMSKCNHFILSNSSFSWWAQYLNGKANKIVIAPERWNAAEGPFEDIYVADWHLIAVGGNKKNGQ